MRRPSRLALAAATALLPLTLLTACSTDDGGVRTENGTGIDDKSVPSPGEDSDQSDSDDLDQAG